MNTKFNMPNFLIIGANKAGTTSLYHYLKQHPQIYMSPVKEPMFFKLMGKQLDTSKPGCEITLKYAVNNINDYSALFNDVSDEKAIGEASTAYLHNPYCAELIKKYIPDVKIIVVLRNPVERAYSNYLMYVRWGLETLDFEEAVREEEPRMRNDYPQGWQYIKLGFYYEPLKFYFDMFNRSQIKVFLYEDFCKDSVGMMQDIFHFLDVDESFVPDTSQRHNVYVLPKNNRANFLINLLKPIKRVLKMFFPLEFLRYVAYPIKKRIYTKPKLPAEMRGKLVEVYKQDILNLQELIDRDLLNWLT
jgi:hypothetical protein